MTSEPRPDAGLSGLPLVVLLSCTALTVMANATISAALPSLRDHFKSVPAIDTVAGLAMTLPSLGVVLTAFLFGWISDRIGRRPILLAGLVLYALAGVSGFFLEGLPAILVGRFLLGCAVGAVMTAATAMGGDYFAAAGRERFMGLLAMSMSLGGILFMLGGGLLATLSWRAPFLAYGAAALLLPLVFALLPEAPKPPGGPADAGAEPMPWRFVAFVCGLALFGMVLFYMVPVKAPFLLREIGYPSPLLAGVIGAVMTAGGAVAGARFSAIRKHLEPQRLLAASMIMAAVGYGLITISGNAWLMALGVFVAGFGFGLQMPNQANWLLSQVPGSRRGAATGMLTSAIFLGQFASPLFAGPVSGVIGLGNTYGVAAGLLVVAAGLLFATAARPAS
jgi:MFS family permease